MFYPFPSAQTPPPVYEQVPEPSYQEVATEEDSDEPALELADSCYGQEW